MPLGDRAFESAFRDWDGGTQALVIPRFPEAHVLDPLARARTFFAMVPNGYVNVRDTVEATSADDLPGLPVRSWLLTHDCPPLEELSELWLQHGYRSLTFHEALDYAETYLSERKRGLRPFRHVPFLAGVEVDLTVSQIREDRRVVLYLAETEYGLSLLCEAPEWVSQKGGAAFLLTPLNAQADELAPPTEGGFAHPPYSVRVPRRWDPSLGPDPFAEP